MIACVDWLSYTVGIPHGSGVWVQEEERYQQIGYAENLAKTLLPDVPLSAWRLGNGRHGFRHQLKYEGIGIMYGGIEAGGTADLMCVNISGQGCRTIEDKRGEMSDFLVYVQSNSRSITRLDLAIDDKDGILDINDLYNRSGKRRLSDGSPNPSCMWWGKPRVSSRIDGDQGTTMYFGSASSLVRIRIYDKAMEQKICGHWVRVEIVLRQEKAKAGVALLMAYNDAGSVIASVLRDQLVFLDCPAGELPTAHESEYAELHRLDAWDEFLEQAEGLPLASSTKTERTWQGVSHFIEVQTARALAIYCDILGIQSIQSLIESKKAEYTGDDLRMIEQYKQSAQPVNLPS